VLIPPDPLDLRHGRGVVPNIVVQGLPSLFFLEPSPIPNFSKGPAPPPGTTFMWGVFLANRLWLFRGGNSEKMGTSLSRILCSLPWACPLFLGLFFPEGTFNGPPEKGISEVLFSSLVDARSGPLNLLRLAEFGGKEWCPQGTIPPVLVALESTKSTPPMSRWPPWRLEVRSGSFSRAPSLTAKSPEGFPFW